MNAHRGRQFAFARLLSSAVTNQAVLSAGSFAIGLILIRNTSDIQFGYYILASNAIIFLMSLQNAFFNPPLAIRMHQLDQLGRGELIGGMYREQRRILSMLGIITMLVALALWSVHILDSLTGPLVLVTVVAALAILNREYFRMVLFAYRRPHDVLRIDIFYLILMLSGVIFATLTPTPAVTAMFTLSLSAILSGMLLSRQLRRHYPWDIQGSPGILRKIAPLSAWSTAGASIHWAFSQGYIYLVAGTLDVMAVAAIAATRLLLMPVNLLSTGIGSLMLPLASGWLQRHGTTVLWRRLCMLALGLAVITLCYFTVLWLLRDWIFTVILKKQFAQRDTLLLLWGAVFLVLVMRDQLVYLIAAQGRFRSLTLLTSMCAIISLAVSYLAMQRYGMTGALIGILVGEIINIAGVVLLSLRKTEQPVVPTTA